MSGAGRSSPDGADGMDDPASSGRRPSRVADAAFGLLFLGLAAAIVIFSGEAAGIGPWAAALAIGGLGADALLAALRGRRSLVSRLGPLP